MLAFIDNFLNRITMYRLMFYYLIALLVVAAIFGAFGMLPINPAALAVSALIILAACWSTNKIFAAVFKAPANVESAYITAFILALIISPIAVAPFDVAGFWFLIAASVFAMGSKYILAINKKHIFNPAAIAVALTAVALNQYASWWSDGNLQMLAFVAVGGLLIVRKIQRFDLVITFFAAALASIMLFSFLAGLSFNPLVTAEKALIHTSLFFFAFVMLTEPLTTPPTRPLRIMYGLFVGALFAPSVHIGPIYSTPELALAVGNIFSYAVSPKSKFMLRLKSKRAIGADTYDFAFTTGDAAGGKKIKFKPGQYMEFTLPASGPLGADSRGNRRYFTIASSPTEPDLHLGIKFYGRVPDEMADAASSHTSSFKKALLALKPGDMMMGGQLTGDFTLPHDPTRKFVFIAGGIGITPFRSMIKFLSDRGEPVDATLLYSNRTDDEAPYREVFDEAARTIGLKTVYVATGKQGRIGADLITREVPDWKDRVFYISGTHAMVSELKTTLREMKVPQSHIKIDFFPGFA